MDAKEYWHQVTQEKEALVKSLENGIEGQPSAGEKFVYIVSRGTRKNNIKSGVVCITTIELAAQRLVDETHVLASADEINDYLEAQRREASEIRASNFARKAQVVMHVNEKMEQLDGDPGDDKPARGRGRTPKS